MVLHCYENSARKLVELVLHRKLGDNWWEIAANSAQKSKVKSRKETEKSTAGLLLVAIIHYSISTGQTYFPLFENMKRIFLPYIKDIKFVELRFEELERVS